jgi:hypothetical protein
MSPPGPFVLFGTRYAALAGTEEGFTLSRPDQQPEHHRTPAAGGTRHVRTNDGSAR